MVLLCWCCLKGWPYIRAGASTITLYIIWIFFLICTFFRGNLGSPLYQTRKNHFCLPLLVHFQELGKRIEDGERDAERRRQQLMTEKAAHAHAEVAHAQEVHDQVCGWRGRCLFFRETCVLCVGDCRSCSHPTRGGWNHVGGEVVARFNTWILCVFLYKGSVW